MILLRRSSVSRAVGSLRAFAALTLLQICEATFTVELVSPRYVLQGQSVQLRCEYDVQREQLHKVEWFHGAKKIVQFITGRKPPFKYFDIHGAVIDRNVSDENHLWLRDMRFEASGLYSCEVSTQAPIYTKRSDERELAVIQPQQDAPQVWASSESYQPGETLSANCSSAPARPAPSLEWLVNGLTTHQGRHNVSQEPDGEQQALFRATSRFSLQLMPHHTGRLALTCLSTAPAAPDQDRHQLQQTLTVEVVQPASSGEAQAALVSPRVLFLVLVVLSLVLPAASASVGSSVRDYRIEIACFV
ncbi:uncharacterized protein LOC126278790 [Schistocerca gregaria]|uniref:uncharacterized protein LOC126278790 n=1 Tax=Schistocerca gregaria TaxID=7010 RepID=UPI00211EF45A|nr:uncharacterized protein LOC126278790 [Schistocerca gregaria]